MDATADETGCTADSGVDASDDRPDLSGLDGESVAVVGGGFGGLSVACYLAGAGADVTVLEKNEQLGGRASTLQADGFRFDRAPSWYLMPDVFERFFGHFGRSSEKYYSLRRLDPHYRIFFKDGDRVDLLPDAAANRETFEAYEPGAGEALDSYLEQSKRNYEVGMEQFVYADRSRLRDYVDGDVLRHAGELSLLGSMQGYAERYFDHPKLRQMVQYSLVFLGGTPTNTPALYSLMSHADFDLGVYYPEGGIGAVVDGMVELGRELGVDYVTDAEVTAIEGRRGGFAVRTADAAWYPDLVVSDADYAHTEQELLTPEKRQFSERYWESHTYAPSAYLLHLGVEGDVDPLAHHSLVLPTDWDSYFETIFENPAWPEDPVYYLCAPSQTDDDAAPAGHSALSALVPIAAGLDDTPERRESYRELLLDDIAENAGVDLRDRIVFEETFCVDDFADRYNSRRGTAFGLAHTLRQPSLFRPPRASAAVDGLYFAGSDTTPGIGAPTGLASGLLTAEKMARDAP